MRYRGLFYYEGVFSHTGTGLEDFTTTLTAEPKQIQIYDEDGVLVLTSPSYTVSSGIYHIQVASGVAIPNMTIRVTY